MKKLYKSRTDVKIDGVCAGIAKYFDLDPTLVRVVFIALIFCGGSSLWVYLACMIIMPREPKDEVDISVES